jgi:hypothetical protein
MLKGLQTAPPPCPLQTHKADYYCNVMEPTGKFIIRLNVKDINKNSGLRHFKCYIYTYFTAKIHLLKFSYFLFVTRFLGIGYGQGTRTEEYTAQYENEVI